MYLLVFRFQLLMCFVLLQIVQVKVLKLLLVSLLALPLVSLSVSLLLLP